MQRYGISERHACSALGVPRSSIRRLPQRSDDEEILTKDIVRLAQKYGRYGYRRIIPICNQRADKVNFFKTGSLEWATIPINR